MYKQKAFTREELYRLVWERPVLSVAKEIGVSDVAVAKACRKAGIPLPSRGHWAIVNAGKTVKTPPLPKSQAGQSDSISFSILENAPPMVSRTELPTGPSIEIPTELVKPHRLVAELKAAAKGQREDKGVIPLNYHKFLRVKTSVAQLERALILMDTLIKQFEDKGYKVRVSEKDGQTELVLKEGVVAFRLDERTKRVAPPPPPSRPPGRRGEHYHEPWQPTFVLVGTGEFTLSFDRYRLGSCPNNWKDRAGSPIEARLHEVVAAVPSWNEKLLADQIQKEEREAREQVAKARLVNAARADEILRLQRVKLVNGLRSWERAERLRRFIAAFEASSDQSPDASAWLAWANLQAQALDPLCSNVQSLTDPRVPLSDYFTGRGPWEKQPMDWWYFDPKERTSLGLDEDSEDELEDEAGEIKTAGQPNDPGADPAWLPHQWYTRPNR